MRKWFSILLIMIGSLCFIIALYPIFEMNQQVNQSLNEWENLKNQYSSDLNQEQEIENLPLTDGVIGTLQIKSYNEIIPIRMGTTDAILKQGIGVDESTVSPGELGNSGLYGHRENILWNLKHVEIGDEIEIETLNERLVFKITDIKILDPEDDYIYQSADIPTITLVTCYPFIYMGPTPERYVVKAVLESSKKPEN